MSIDHQGLSEYLAAESEYFKCRCPEPDRPGWMHRTPIECAPLAPGETVEEWRGRRYDGRLSVPYALDRWHQQMATDGWASVGRISVEAATAEERYGHAWDRIVLGSETPYYD